MVWQHLLPLRCSLEGVTIKAFHHIWQECLRKMCACWETAVGLSWSLKVLCSETSGSQSLPWVMSLVELKLC